ncbi:hypothetical protein [Glutamicibacter protophormiae]|uniref:hypothetical protein n=1 Tax=Glutamicibacter protophormiae TaxID=37930 RepID=UPI001957D8D9|nr:hypothetical protein [Glutamicibacter protophormiae]QRQ79801.1 hypothetical protein JQN66_06210 [Glutamicibacter protophormiae]
MIDTLPHLLSNVNPTFALLAVIGYFLFKKAWPVLKDLQGVPQRVTELERVTDEHGEDIFYLKQHTKYVEPALPPRRK